MAIYEFEEYKPIIGKGSFVHPEATIIGNVILGEDCYIGPGARIRAEWGKIVIGAKSNIQDNCVIHVFPDETAWLGLRSHIGHGAILHTPNLEEHVVVGMGAIILDHSKIGAGCCIGAGAVVTENSVIPPYSLVVGVPAKIMGQVKESMRITLEQGTDDYIELTRRCRSGMKELDLNKLR